MMSGKQKKILDECESFVKRLIQNYDRDMVK